MLSAGAIFSQGLASPIMGTNPDAPIKLGVNGFGRIGRQVVRIAMDRESMVLKHINSPMTPEYMKYLLEHETKRLGRHELCNNPECDYKKTLDAEPDEGKDKVN